MRKFIHLSILAAGSGTLALGQGRVLEVLSSGGPTGGSAVVSTGDVDGDGRPDLAIGSSGPINGGGGFVTVVSGATGARLYQPHLDADAYSTGHTLANLGDVDSDGIADLAAGDDTWGTFGDRPGSVTITRGGSGTLIRLLEGEDPQDLFGWSLDRVPDVDGDGVLDLVVGAPGYEDSIWNSGAVYLYSGATQSLIWFQEGVEVDGAFGYTVRGIDDLDGDGRGDVVATAPGETSATGEHAAGRTLLLSGATGSTIRVLDVGSADDQSGRTVEVIGDLNGDQLPEILLGSPFASQSGLSAGRVEVISSADGSILSTFRGSEDGNLLGMHLAAAGDLDGDGIGDYAYSERAFGAHRGETIWNVISGATTQPLFRVISRQSASDRRPAAPAGDANGDGINDFAVGSPIDERVLVYQLGGPVEGAICYGEPHSASQSGARLFAGSPSDFLTSQNDTSLLAIGLPRGAGIFLTGTTVDSTPMMGGSQGTLCIGASGLGRYAGNVLFNDPNTFAESVSMTIDNTAIPQNATTVAAVPGDTFYFQYWFRDSLPSGSATSNLSDAVAVTFR